MWIGVNSIDLYPSSQSVSLDYLSLSIPPSRKSYIRTCWPIFPDGARVNFSATRRRRRRNVRFCSRTGTRSRVLRNVARALHGLFTLLAGENEREFLIEYLARKRSTCERAGAGTVNF